MSDIPKVINSRVVYAGTLFDLNVDELDFGGGVTAQREIIRHPGAVAMVPIDADGNILMVTQYRHAAGRRLLELPAGTLETGEDPLEAVERELREEVGYRPGQVEPLGGFYVAPGYTDEYIRIYVCTDLEESALDADEDEDIEIEHMSPADALKAVANGGIVDAKSIIGIIRWDAYERSRRDGTSRAD